MQMLHGEPKQNVPVEQLAHAIGQGDKKMEGEFYRRYYPSTLRLLSGFTTDKARAEDITHDALIKVLLRLRNNTLDQPKYLTRFVHQTAKYSMLDWVRCRRNQVELHESVDDLEPGGTDSLQQITNDEELARVRKLVEGLRVERDRDILLRFYFYDEPKPVICEALDLSAGHFDRVISRARSRLGKNLHSARE